MRSILLLLATSSLLACMPPVGDGQNATSVTPDGEFDPGRRDNSDDDTNGDNNNNGNDDNNNNGSADLLEPGSACNCDSECAGSEQTPGLCFQGICMTRSSRRCSEAGSRVECQEGLRCWGAEG